MSSQPDGPDIEKAVSHTEQQENVNSEVATPPVVARIDDDFKFTFSKWLALLSLVIGFLEDVLVLTMSSAVLTTINKDLSGGTNSNYTWIASANYTAVSCLSPFVGRLGDIFGRRNILIAGNLVAAIGCIVAAVGQNVNTVIGGSVLIGVGSSGHQVSWSCIGEIVPRNYRSMAIGFFEASATPASAFGALIALTIVDHTTWRWIYWICLMLNCVALALTLFFYHPVNQYITEEGKTKWQQVKSLDWIGVFLFAAGLVLFLLGLSFGGNKYPWKSAGTLAPLLIGTVIIFVTGGWEAYTRNPYAIYPHVVMRNFRGFTIPLGVTFLVGILYYSTLILWPEEIQVLFTQNSTKVGLYSMALGLGGSLAGLLTGWIFKKFDQARWILLFIVIAMTAVGGAQALVRPGTYIGSTILVILGGFLGSSATIAVNTMVQLSIPHQYIGVAMGLVITARNVGGSIATTIYTVVLSNNLKSHLGLNIATALAKAGLPLADIPAVTEALATQNVTSPAFSLANTTQLEAGIYAVKVSYTDAFRLVYLISIVFGGLGILCAFWTKNFGHLMTRQLDVRLEEGAHLSTHLELKGGHVIDHDGTELKQEISSGKY